jgi:hypothetical protein
LFRAILLVTMVLNGVSACFSSFFFVVRFLEMVDAGSEVSILVSFALRDGVAREERSKGSSCSISSAEGCLRRVDRVIGLGGDSELVFFFPRNFLDGSSTESK